MSKLNNLGWKEKVALEEGVKLVYGNYTMVYNTKQLTIQQARASLRGGTTWQSQYSIILYNSKLQ